MVIISFVRYFQFAEKRRDFERRRKLHYNEFEAVLRARQLMEQDEDEDDRIEIDETTPSAKWNGTKPTQFMDQ